MTSASTLGTPALPTLPHWEAPPADLKAAIREIKAALRARIDRHGSCRWSSPFSVCPATGLVTGRGRSTAPPRRR